MNCARFVSCLLSASVGVTACRASPGLQVLGESDAPEAGASLRRP